MKMTAKEILRRPYSRVLTPEEDGGFSGSVLEFPGCFAQGDTAADAYANLESAAESWVEAAFEQQIEIPEPVAAQRAGGKLLLRLPRSLHQRLTLLAERDGVSLNQYVVAALAERVGAATAGTRLVTEAQRMVRGVSMVLREAAGTLRAATSKNSMTVQSFHIEASATSAMTVH